ncbi:MAG TPA: hypothetical protein DCQ50_16245 [Chryseobacterium sp.]|nr:hypothetical protein [Chryseobacterium sp.]
MGNENYPQIIFSPLPIKELVENLVEQIVERLADELERRTSAKSLPTPDSPPPEKKRLYGDKAAAAHIGCTPQVIGKLRKDGKIRYYTLGTRYYYYAHELDQDLTGRKNRFGELRGRRQKQ